jgi:hypothetical protein
MKIETYALPPAKEANHYTDPDKNFGEFVDPPIDNGSNCNRQAKIQASVLSEGSKQPCFQDHSNIAL